MSHAEDTNGDIRHGKDVPVTHDENTQALRAVEGRVLALEQANGRLQDAVDDNTRLTTSIKQDTAGLVEFAKAAQGVVTVGRWMGKVLTFLAPIVAAAVAWWAARKGQ